MNTPFTLLVKPISAQCNLRCRYCFYLDHLRPQEMTRMSDETLEHLIREYMKTKQSQYGIGFQGGEPTLMGIDFFEKVVRLQKKYAPQNARISNAVQTNGTLITPELAHFFSTYNFLLGVSLDGPEDLHDPYRRDARGEPTHKKVMEGISILREEKTPFNILCLVNNINGREPERVYRYFREQKFRYLQFIPCVEYDENGNLEEYSVTPEVWGNFLNGIFECWYPKDVRRVSIRLFDSILNKIVHGHSTVCDSGRDCRQYFLIEHNGDIYPCDFFVYDKYKLGSIYHNNWEELLKMNQYRQFGERKTQWNKRCDSCDILAFCHGDCPKNRNPHNQNLSFLCEGYRTFYHNALRRIHSIADNLK